MAAPPAGSPARRLAILSRLVILGLALVIAAASFNGFYTKWAFRDADPKLSLNSMLDGTAGRPFAYRRLIVDAANAIDRVAPPAAGRVAERLLHKPDGSFRFAFPAFTGSDPSRAFRFELVYFTTYLAAVALLFVAYALARDEGIEPIAAGAGASLFLLLFPMLQSAGGYFYDYSEAVFFCLFLVLARRAWWPAMLAVAVLATWNKESFFFFALTAFPLLRARKSLLPSAAITGGCVLLAGLTYEVQRIRFAANPGATTESHVAGQIHSFLTGSFLVKPEVTYGITLPHPFSLPWIVAIGTAVALGWRWVSRPMRAQIAIAAVINVPLFLLFCQVGEARNLSMLFPGLLVVMAAGFQAAALRSSAARSPETVR